MPRYSCGEWYSFLLQLTAQCGKDRKSHKYVCVLHGSASNQLLPRSFYSIYKASRGESVRRKLYIVASVFGPIASYSVAISLWAWSPYSIILEQEHFILFTVTVGIMFGFMASNIILAHLTKSPFPSFYGLLGALWLMAILIGIVPRIFEMYVVIPFVTAKKKKIDSNFFHSRLVSATAELYVLWVFFALSAIVYGIWASTVINKFCEFLGIRCLKIPHSGERVAVSSSTQGNLCLFLSLSVS